MCSNQAFHTHQASRGDAAATIRRPARKTRGALSPTFQLFGGKIETLPAALKALSSHRSEVEQAARSVGRIHQGPVTLGTGFVIGPNVIMTARHVAQAFGTDVDGLLKIRIGWTPAIDFLAEEPPPFSGPDTAHESAPQGETSKAAAEGRGKSVIDLRAEPMPAKHLSDYHRQPAGEANACYPIRSILYDNEEFDIALLLVPFTSALPRAERDAMGEARFEPLTLATDAPSADRRDVCVIGCPDEDPFATETERNSIFKGVFDVKRVQPGAINRVLMEGAVLGHTCSTLRGNSGSPVIDLQTNTVIGLHRRGSREQPGEEAMNEATALWLLPAAVTDILKAARDIYAPKEDLLTSSESASVVTVGADTATVNTPRKIAAAAGKSAGAAPAS